MQKPGKTPQKRKSTSVKVNGTKPVKKADLDLIPLNTSNQKNRF
jgi:hypothetical protein